MKFTSRDDIKILCLERLGSLEAIPEVLSHLQPPDLALAEQVHLEIYKQGPLKAAALAFESRKAHPDSVPLRVAEALARIEAGDVEGLRSVWKDIPFDSMDVLTLERWVDCSLQASLMLNRPDIARIAHVEACEDGSTRFPWNPRFLAARVLYYFRIGQKVDAADYAAEMKDAGLMDPRVHLFPPDAKYSPANDFCAKNIDVMVMRIKRAISGVETMAGIEGRGSSPIELGSLLKMAPQWPVSLALAGALDPSAGDSLPPSISTVAKTHGLYWMVMASKLVEPFDRRAAIPFGRKAVLAEPWNVDFMAFHAINCHREGLEDEAWDLLAKAHALEPRKPEVYNLMTLLKSVAVRHVSIDTPLYRLSLREDEAPALGSLLTDTLDREFADLSKRYALKPSKIYIYFYSDKQDFDVSVFGVPSAPALGACMGRLVTMPSPLYLEAKLEPWASVLRHEMAHAFHCERSGGRVPRWFTEGLAHYEEFVEDPSWDWEEGFDQKLLTLKAKNELAHFGNLNSGFNGPDVRFYYQYCRWVMQWIDETKGWGKILECLDHFKNGGNDPSMMQRVLKLDNAAAEEDFFKWLETHVISKIPLVPLSGGELNTESGLATAYAGGFHRDILEATQSPSGNNPSMWLYKALVHDDLGEDQQAREAFDKAAAGLDKQHFILNYRFGRHLYETGDYIAAEPRLRSAAKTYPRHLEEADNPHYWLFELLRETGRTSEAYEPLWEYTRVQQKEHRARFWLLKEAMKRQDKERIEILKTEIRRVHPYHFEALIWDAQSAMDRGQPEKAADDCARLFACAPLKGLVDQDTPWTDAERLEFLRRGADIWLRAVADTPQSRQAAEVIKSYLPEHDGALKILGEAP
ncbi:MAG: tetratricopeptide repeat protein [Planctomycetota bacterium]